ncbi:transglycosylase SLT domain-containing protein [Pseudoxanthomonas sangjuensis]|uniref:transglycosylase SLT domain-containing protein n=1 Tax=Pseudoxanthomonas sangjuensis TaxID=1503750 RepID=UPI001391ACC8|nr:transglycosylase SLT domain-containing protein [Pseudoxanthomonas sangjuensis]KAF1715040.1 lytic transglycosylase [Pseudoxanthomonas sangjuensis]
MSAFPKFFRRTALAGLLFSFLAPAALAASAREQAAIEAIHKRMAAATVRYQNAQQLSAEGDPAGDEESDAALAEMEAVLDACALQRGCEVSPLLAAYKSALMARIGTEDGLEDENDLDEDEPLASDDHALLPNMPESERMARLLNDQRHDFDKMVRFNPAIEAGIRRWLTDMRPQLIDSYENYRNMRAEIYPQWERDGLPEPLLFGILAKESNGKVHVTSRAGAAGPLQFMPATGLRFGLGPDGTGFDTRYDPRSAGYASADYLKERMAELGGSIELALAAYNGGEGRALRVYQQHPGRSFWDDEVYYQFPAETRDYVPMVIAAGWLFLHPRQYGLKFPRVNPKPALLQLARASSLNELTMCLGNGGTRDGFLRTLRNLNPRYQPDSLIPYGTDLRANTRIVRLYRRYCDKGPRAELARMLNNANVGAAIVRTGNPLPTGTVAVGDVTSLPGAATAERAGGPASKKNPKPAPVKRYKVKKGDTLGRIANKYDCSLKQLARANGLRAPSYVVKPGQSLKLEGCGK